MAFDPLQEDCHRLILGALRREGAPPTAEASIARLMAQYQDDPSELIVHDNDRSFHLVAEATTIVDYRIPFETDDAEADRLTQQVENMLREAVHLDENNWDAKRMLCGLTAESADTYITYMEENLEEVEHDLAQTVASAQGAYEKEFAEDLARRPYLRWLAALSSRQLISGRYTAAFNTAERSLLYAPHDPADIRLTALLALSKLECSLEDIKQFRARHGIAFRASHARRRPRSGETAPCAWTLIAEMNAAYRAFDYDAATHALRCLLRNFSKAGEVLFYQTEFPEGIYARVNVAPQSTDELVLAVSEAMPLLQEGFGGPEAAGFAVWLATHDLVQAELSAEERRASAAQQRRTGGEN